MKTVAKIIGGLAVLGLILALLIPGGLTKQSAYQAKVRSDMRQICLAVIVHYESLGKMPKSLSELPEETLHESLLYFYDPESERPYDWLFFGDRLRHKEIKPDSVLLVAPTIFGTTKNIPKENEERFRMVGFMGGYVERLTEAEFEALMVDQDDSINSVTSLRSSTP